jgi:hypothetical protein
MAPAKALTIRLRDFDGGSIKPHRREVQEASSGSGGI